MMAVLLIMGLLEGFADEPFLNPAAGSIAHGVAGGPVR